MRLLRPALGLFLLLSLLTGIAYPLLITGLARILFPDQASGSLLRQGDRLLGSALIGQPFTDPRYFWGRPSATAPAPYNPLASGGSNLGPRHPALVEAARARLQALRQADPDQSGPVPLDLLTASGSGLDPHISPAAAEYQIQRVARARGRSPEAIRALVARHAEGRQFGFLGEPRVHVLGLNLALDRLP